MVDRTPLPGGSTFVHRFAQAFKHPVPASGNIGFSKGCEPPTISGELKMRTALFLSSVAAGVLAVSTMSFAQNYGAYAQAVGEAAQATTVTPCYGAPLGRYTRPDAGYRGSVTAPRNKTARPVAPAIDGPAPAQER
jgi:hypothetical protein